MKAKLQFLTAMALFLASCNNPRVTEKKVKVKASADLKKGKINCMLVDSLGKTAGCGIFSVTVGIKFKALLENEKQPQYFIGLVRCPELYGNNFFKVDSAYNMKLSDTSNYREEMVVNPYENDSLPLLYVDSLVKVAAR